MLDVRGKNIYLSGPITGKPYRNAAVFAEAEVALYDMGAEYVYNPVEENLSNEELGHDQYMRTCLNALTKDNDYSYGSEGPRYAILALLPGWRKSDGANVEREVAMACGIEVVEIREVKQPSLGNFGGVIFK